MNKKHWNTVELDSGIPQTELRNLIDHSYELVGKSFPEGGTSEIAVETAVWSQMASSGTTALCKTSRNWTSPISIPTPREPHAGNCPGHRLTQFPGGGIWDGACISC